MLQKTKAEVLAEYTFQGIEQVHGVTHDGQNAWIAVGDRLQAVAPDGALGRAISVHAQAGSAFDGRHFYQIAAGKIQKVDPTTGAVVAIVPAPPDADYAGLTWAEGALWVGQYEGRRILKLDPETGRVLRTVRSDRLVTGVTFAEGELWKGDKPSSVAWTRAPEKCSKRSSCRTRSSAVSNTMARIASTSEAARAGDCAWSGVRSADSLRLP